MASIRFNQVGKTWGAGKTALQDINLTIADGEFLVLVGPSGCGKSTLLRMIAGLESISSGELWIGEQLANHLPPAQRGLAMVFQSYALYPHMNVFDNMGFALKMAGQSKPQIAQAVTKAAEILQITPLLQSKPGQLSGGQRQRVAIGRAIVRQPKVFLFDEPLSNLDASLRLQMRLEIARLHQQLNTTMVYVTHDQVEAMTLGQRIVVLRAGKIEQVGTPQTLYEQPCNLFVAGFLGTPSMNFLPARFVQASAQTWQIQSADSLFLLPQTNNSVSTQPSAGQALTLGIRAEHLELLSHANAQSNLLAATVKHIEYLGDAAQVYLSVAGISELLCARHAAGRQWQAGQTIWCRLPSQYCHLFNADGVAICHGTSTPVPALLQADG